uniref:Uncharacterized protein n=1 Tax=Rhizophora mucronata TaxID=61149 RepID=A0A2P2MAT1_RHIMU
MEGVSVSLDFMVMIVVNALVLTIAMDMANAYRTGFVNVKMASLALTALQLFVMNNAASTVGSVIMEFVNSVAQTMQATHVRTAPHLSRVFQSAKMCWRLTCLVNTVHQVSRVYCNS